MDALLRQEEKEMVELFRQFAEKEVRPISAKYDEKGEFPAEVFAKAAEIGLTTLHLPEKYGGSVQGCIYTGG